MESNPTPATEKQPRGTVLVCAKCHIEPVSHSVTEKQEYEMNGEIFKLDKNGEKIKLPRKVTTGTHCPKCFRHNGYVYVLGSLVRKFKVSSFNKLI